MCLGIPGMVSRSEVGDRDFVEVEIASIRRMVHIGMLADSPIAVGDWLLIHVGFAIAKLPESEALSTIDFQARSGKDYREELDAFASLMEGEDRI